MNCSMKICYSLPVCQITRAVYWNAINYGFLSNRQRVIVIIVIDYCKLQTKIIHKNNSHPQQTRGYRVGVVLFWMKIWSIFAPLGLYQYESSKNTHDISRFVYSVEFHTTTNQLSPNVMVALRSKPDIATIVNGLSNYCNAMFFMNRNECYLRIFFSNRRTKEDLAKFVEQLQALGERCGEEVLSKSTQRWNETRLGTKNPYINLCNVITGTLRHLTKKTQKARFQSRQVHLRRNCPL